MTNRGETQTRTTLAKGPGAAFRVVGVLVGVFGIVMLLVDATQATTVGPGPFIAIAVAAVLLVVGYVIGRRRP